MSASSPTGRVVATTRVDSRRRRMPDLRELYRYRQLAMVLGRRDITVRYRQTVFGTLWLFAGALVTAGLFSFVFGRVAELPTGGVPYFVFAFAGLLGWNLYTGALSGSSGSLNPNAGIITKIYFPRLILPLSTLAGVFINLIMSGGIMLVLLFAYGIPLTFQILVLPFWLLLTVMFAMGLGMFFTAFSVTYRDVGYAVPILTSLLLYLSPVAYSIEAVPEDLRNLYLLNPLATMIEGCRWSLLGGSSLLPAWAIVYTVVISLVALIVGMAVFAFREASFADVI